MLSDLRAIKCAVPVSPLSAILSLLARREYQHSAPLIGWLARYFRDVDTHARPPFLRTPALKKHLGYGTQEVNAEPFKSVSPHASSGRLVGQALVTKLTFIGTAFRTTFLK